MRSNEFWKIDLRRVFELLLCVFYAWYFLPICNAFFDGGLFKVLFFGCFAVGCVGMLLLNHKFHLNGVILAIGAYLLVFSLLYLANVGDASKHIRVSFTFWGTGLLYFGILGDGSRLRLGKYLLVLFGITVITSGLGVMLNNSAARTIAHAAADDALQKSFRLMNISSICLFQCLVCFVPVLVLLPKDSKKQKLISMILLLVILFVLLNASFTISLIVFVVALVFSIFLKGNTIKRMIATAIIGIIAIIFLANGSEVLYFLSNIIGNEKIAVRLRELSVGLSTGILSGDAGLRWELYMSSIITFLKNPFGVGANYSYIIFDNGIGHHSQLLDDLARYGLIAIAFYAVFLIGYYRNLKQAWNKLGCPQVATVVTLIYILFLILNLGFRSADESIVMLFIMPVIPKLIEQYQNKNNLL